MGFCYSGRRLCCDLCGAAGARKVRCPFGWCPSTAACPACRNTHGKTKLGRTAHRAYGCEANHNLYMAAEAKRLALLAAGHWLRAVALAMAHPGTCKVWFRNLAGEEMAVRMPTEIYLAFPVGEAVTLERFETLAGTLPREPVNVVGFA